MNRHTEALSRLRKQRPNHRSARWSALALALLTAGSWIAGDFGADSMLSERRLANMQRFLLELWPHPLQPGSFDISVLLLWVRDLMGEKGDRGHCDDTGYFGRRHLSGGLRRGDSGFGRRSNPGNAVPVSASLTTAGLAGAALLERNCCGVPAFHDLRPRHSRVYLGISAAGYPRTHLLATGPGSGDPQHGHPGPSGSRGGGKHGIPPPGNASPPWEPPDANWCLRRYFL